MGRRFWIHILLVIILCATMGSSGLGVLTWQYWVVLLGSAAIYLNASFDD